MGMSAKRGQLCEWSLRADGVKKPLNEFLGLPTGSGPSPTMNQMWTRLKPQRALMPHVTKSHVRNLMNHREIVGPLNQVITRMNLMTESPIFQKTPTTRRNSNA